MSISTLSKISVPLASDSSASSQGLLMPKLKYRFRVTLENFGVSTPSTELTKQVVDVSRPNVSFEPIELDVYNSRTYLAGKHKWDPLSLNLRDDVNNSVQKLVGEQLQRQFDFFEQSSAASGADYKFVTRIEMLDGGNGVYTPNVLETWECYGCFIVSANYGELAYSSNDPATIALSIQFDNAIQTPQGTGLGTNVGRTINSLVTGGGAF
jgi:hypothetical protein